MKKRILKMISVLTTVLLLCSALSLFAYAQEETPAIELLHLREYSLDALREVSPDDWHAYLEAYRKEHNMEPLDNPKVRWGSSRDNVNLKTHEYLAIYAFFIMLEENGNAYPDFPTLLAEASILSISAGDPDEFENDLFYVAHFYDPDTGKNYLGQSNPTAKTKAVEHYYQALEYVNIDREKALKEVGYALHYLQDVCEPHHAANMTAIDHLSHPMFEEYVDNNFEMVLDSIIFEPLGADFYRDAFNTSVGNYVHNSAASIKPYSALVNDIGNASAWKFTAAVCVAYTTYRSAGLLYKFAKQSYTMI